MLRFDSTHLHQLNLCTCPNTAACDRYLPLGSDAWGMLRFKDHDVDRQRGRGSQMEGEAPRELTDSDMDNAAHINLGCVAATGMHSV